MIRILAEAKQPVQTELFPEDEKIRESYGEFMASIQRLQDVAKIEKDTGVQVACNDLAFQLKEAGKAFMNIARSPQTFDDLASGIESLAQSLIQLDEEGAKYGITDYVRPICKKHMIDTKSGFKRMLNQIIAMIEAAESMLSAINSGSSNDSNVYDISSFSSDVKNCNKLYQDLFKSTPKKGKGNFSNSGMGEVLLSVLTSQDGRPGTLGSSNDKFDVKTGSGVPLEVKNASSGSFKLKFRVKDPNSLELIYWDKDKHETLVIFEKMYKVHVIKPGDYGYLWKHFHIDGSVIPDRRGVAEVDMTIGPSDDKEM